VFVALATNSKVQALNLQLSGSREEIRVAAAEAALQMLLEEIKA
jgi:nicotinamide mononucleotide (NMN) deamidase PncC